MDCCGSPSGLISPPQLTQSRECFLGVCLPVCCKPSQVDKLLHMLAAEILGQFPPETTTTVKIGPDLGRQRQEEGVFPPRGTVGSHHTSPRVVGVHGTRAQGSLRKLDVSLSMTSPLPWRSSPTLPLSWSLTLGMIVEKCGHRVRPG